MNTKALAKVDLATEEEDEFGRRAPLLPTSEYETLARRFQPIFDRIAAGAVERERTRTLPYEPIRWLKEAGFGAVRVPRDYGGGGATLSDLTRLLIELAEADSNLPQALRAHFGFVEDRLVSAPGPERDAWLKRFAAGEIVGGAWTETGNVKLGDVITRLTPSGNGWLLNGTKYYSTGSIFADWIDVYTRRADTGADVIALVSTHQAGVERHDDWNGFGQRTTGSGTTVFKDAFVEDENVFSFGSRFKYQTAFYQLVLVAVLAGIAKAAERDVARHVRDRTRVYSHGNARRPAEDIQIQQVVGRIAADAYAAEAIAVRAGESVHRAYEAYVTPDSRRAPEAHTDAEIESAKAQVAIADIVLRATGDLFNALGASATADDKALDRHWRNARTVLSHNPLIYKEKILGDWTLNRNEPVYVWQIGQG
ncbi:acyl-CoA dehydrogenase family protein [Microvirga pakistanensis]|uniref:acyl-CoA dehydrogenase family protein n=1 Tax=Microvirga pakistanensis TaxID=1682650 RepID=UPI00106C8931|nr:acyl-CoA dehydrogenase family protein [Microvirga pakistanensis]